MAGPLVEVNTIVAGVNLDISRLLNMGSDVVLRFVVPDTTQSSGFRVVLALVDSWDRARGLEKTRDDKSDVIFKVADIHGVMPELLELDDLHVEQNGIYYTVIHTDPVPESATQVFVITCKDRAKRSTFSRRR
jgi:hypothetical protein